MNKRLLLTPAILTAALSPFGVQADKNMDLDDVREWDIVRMETCLDAAIDAVGGYPQKLEMTIEGGHPVYEFKLKVQDGQTFSVECNARQGFITEIERQVDKDDAIFASMAKVSEQEARARALAIHPGKVWDTEYEVGFDGEATYEFSIESKNGYEVKVDVLASTGEIEEANMKVYEIGH